jgi:RNA-directed DNA polymerase
MSLCPVDTPRPFQPPVVQRDLEAEVAHCVGGVLSPLLSNAALAVLDEYFVKAWAAMGPSHARERRRRKGLANYRLIRYADDFVVMVAGTRADAASLREEVAVVLAEMGLRLSEAKTRMVHLDEGFDFLGFRIQRHRQPGSTRRHLYTYPSKAALAAIKTKVRTATREGKNEPLAILLGRLNPVLRGWTNYFRHGVSKATFNYLRAFVWRRVVCWLRHKHPTMTWKELRQRYLAGWWPAQGETVLVDPARVHVTRYRYRGDRIPSPWTRAERMQPTVA